MQFTTTLLTALAGASAVLAAPLSTFAATEWTIQSLSRTCAADGSTCEWTFGIDTGEGEPTPCSYVVGAASGKPASQSGGGPVACGAYTVTSGWSDQFGADEAFTTLSVVDYDKKLIVYPGYTDKQVADGQVVTPDLSFPVQTLP